MAKAVLTTKVDPSYDDLPEERYHFPRTYLNAVRQPLHDWIVYYEPRRVSAEILRDSGDTFIPVAECPRQGARGPSTRKPCFVS